MKLLAKKTKFIVVLVLSMAILSLLILPTNLSLKTTAMAGIEPKIVKVGWFQVEGLQNINDNQQRSGYAYEYLQTLANYGNFKYEFVDCTFAEAEEFLNNGAIDLIAVIRKTPKRELMYDFSKNSCGQNYGVVTKNKNNINLFGARPTIGITKNSIWLNTIVTELQAQGINAKLVVYDTNEEAYQALENQTVQYLIHNNFAKIRDYEEIVREVLPERFYFAVKKGNNELIDGIDLAMEQIIINDPNFEYSLQSKYLNKKSGNVFSLNEKDKQIINKYKKIRLGVNEFSGLGFNIDSKTNEASGIYVDFCKQLTNLIGLEIELVPFKDALSGKLMFEEGKIDGFVAAQYDYAKANLNNMKITVPYYDMKLAVITKKNKDPFAGDSIVSYVDRISWVQEYLENKYPDIELIQFLNVEEAIDDIEKGQVDALVMPSLLSDYYLLRTNDSMLLQHLIPVKKGISIGFSSKMENSLVDVFNKAISSFDDDYFDSLVKLKNINNIKPTTFATLISNEPYWTLFFTVLTITLIVAIMVMFKFHKYSTQTINDLEKDNQEKISFLSHISHELRTPINGLNGTFDLMALKTNSSGRNSRNIQKAKNSLIQLNGLINNVLDFLRLEKNKLAIIPSLNIKGEIISRADTIVNPIAKSKNITINKKIDIAQYSYFYIDKSRASQILSNVAIVAIELCKPESVLESEFKVISGGGNKDYIYYEIYGDKINMSFLDVLRFNFKSTKDTGIDTDDINLRLILAKKLTRLMGGKLTVKKHKGEVKFSVKIKCRLVDENDKLCSDSELIKSMLNISQYDFSNLKALVVEDNYINMSIITEYLKSYGISFEKAQNGIEAIKMFFNSPVGYYNIIFMDIMMPKMNGMSATKIIRESSRLDSQVIPIVAMTANTLYEELNKYYEIGMNYQLIKPFDKVHLTEILAREFT